MFQIPPGVIYDLKQSSATRDLMRKLELVASVLSFDKQKLVVNNTFRKLMPAMRLSSDLFQEITTLEKTIRSTPKTDKTLPSLMVKRGQLLQAHENASSDERGLIERPETLARLITEATELYSTAINAAIRVYELQVKAEAVTKENVKLAEIAATPAPTEEKFTNPAVPKKVKPGSDESMKLRAAAKKAATSKRVPKKPVKK